MVLIKKIYLLLMQIFSLSFFDCPSISGVVVAGLSFSDVLPWKLTFNNLHSVFGCQARFKWCEKLNDDWLKKIIFPLVYKVQPISRLHHFCKIKQYLNRGHRPHLGWRSIWSYYGFIKYIIYTIYIILVYNIKYIIYCISDHFQFNKKNVFLAKNIYNGLFNINTSFIRIHIINLKNDWVFVNNFVKW
jgi:hypothetical protein